MGKKVFAIVVMVAVVGGLWMFLRARKTDEGKIKEVFSRLEDAVELEDMDEIRSLLAADYEDSMGNTKEDIVSNLPRAFFGPHAYRLTVSNIQILKHLPQTAAVHCTAKVDYLPEGDVVTDSVEQEVDVSLEKIRGRWRVKSVAGIEGFESLAPEMD